MTKAEKVFIKHASLAARLGKSLATIGKRMTSTKVNKSMIDGGADQVLAKTTGPAVQLAGKGLEKAAPTIQKGVDAVRPIIQKGVETMKKVSPGVAGNAANARKAVAKSTTVQKAKKFVKNNPVTSGGAAGLGIRKLTEE